MNDDSLSDIVDDGIRSLELPAVLEETAGYAHSVPGRMEVLGATPETSLERIREALDLVQEMLEVIGLDKQPAFGDLVPLEGVFSRLEHSAGILDSEELLAVRDVLALCERVKDRLERLGERYRLLRSHAAEIVALETLRSRIDRVFDPHGTIKPTASRRLMEIHDRTRSVRLRINKSLERLVNDRDLARIVQEDYITMRNDRYVILLRPEFKGMLDGIVHDHSRSGASVYVEPLDVVDLNNQVASLLDEEREEVRRILDELTQEVRSLREVIEENYRVLAFLDAFRARALYAKATSSIMPEIDGNGFRILGARHPLLPLGGEAEVVPMDVIQDESTSATVISGANMGGKTVALKIAGLFPLMARCGILLPAREGTRIQPFARIMADIGDEQDIRNRVSSFSGHMVRIKAIIDAAGPGDLVLLDELGGATDPEEGGGLAMAIIDRLIAAKARVVVTTHLTNLKAYALSRSDVRNVSVEFHPTSLMPTFRLLYDLPGESHAIETAERIGMDPEVIASARRYADKAAGGGSSLIESLRNKLSEVEALRDDLAETRRSLEAEIEKVRLDHEGVVEEFRAAAGEMMRNAERQIADLQRSVKEGRTKSGAKPRETLAAIKRGIVEQLGTPLERPVQVPEVGRRVRVNSLGRIGTVRTVLDGGKVEVAAGNITIRADVEDLDLLNDVPDEKKPSKKRLIGVEIPIAQPKWEINVIGLRVHEAVPIIEKALDEALLGGLATVSIVHGKGTGRLKKGVRDHLTAHPLVKSFHSGSSEQGGEGVTVVELRSE
ncbi:MAG: endonuclease MutS2 [Desulfomonilaceae bacterium]|nr:endonuclease MutS2 [Desulfomonilaceae bacterium]